MLKTVTLSSIHRVFPDECPENAAKNHFSALKNEPFSFQVALINDTEDCSAFNVNVRIESDLPISYYYASPISVLHNRLQNLQVPARQGIYYDILVPKQVNPTLCEEGFQWKKMWFEKGEDKVVTALPDAWQCLWFTVNESSKTLSPGKHVISVIFLSGDTNMEIGRENVELDIIDCRLVPQKLYCTNWFYADCVCDAHNVEPMSDEFFTAVYNYAHKAALNGQNMILTPCFTPPLDTPVGCERRTIQLVGVKVIGKNKYSFDFTLLKRFIDVCRKAGIKYFEQNHLFTQWGAKAAPKIVADVNGRIKQIFGWNTPADGTAYKKFLQAYLPAVTDFYRAEGLQKKVLFHISDEPSAEMAESFKAALDAVGNMLDGFMVGDALSHVELYEQGLVKMPIVATNLIDDFIGKCDNMWCYYTGGQIMDGLSNRLPVIAPERNRMIGVQMYSHDIKGFLHWGYNYYYDVLSHGYTDPKMQPGNYAMSSGTSYLVYPAADLDCYQSIRQKVFAEGILDMRALETHEKLCGRDRTDALLKKHFGNISFRTCPETPEQYLAFRDELNSEIKKACAE